MRLNAKVLKNVYSVNVWQYANQAIINEGQVNDFYIQIVNQDLSTAIVEKSQAFPENPIRHMFPTGVTATATFDAVDAASVFSVTATSPFAEDLSIFKFSLTNIQLPNSGNVKITIVSGTDTYVFTMKLAISVTLLNAGSC